MSIPTIDASRGPGRRRSLGRRRRPRAGSATGVPLRPSARHRPDLPATAGRLGVHPWPRGGRDWDNNVLLATEGSGTAGDFFTAVTPRAALGFRGRMTDFDLGYRGTYQIYQELTELNAFDQRATSQYRRRLSPKVNFFARTACRVADDRRSRLPTSGSAAKVW